MSADVGRVYRVTVVSSSPLTVRMRRASTAQAASNLGSAALVADQEVLAVVMDDGSTYVLGSNTAAAGSIVLRSTNGTLYRLIVSNAGALGTEGPL